MEGPITLAGKALDKALFQLCDSLEDQRGRVTRCENHLVEHDALIARLESRIAALEARPNLHPLYQPCSCPCHHGQQAPWPQPVWSGHTFCLNTSDNTGTGGAK